MAIFISLRCEMRGEGRAVWSGTRCWSDDNDDPHVMADDTKKSAADCMTLLFSDAKEAGWKKINGGWVCPNCQKHMREEA
ncbi:hypothetical protein [Serratia marcescens]|uniref:hypothetical protein n=1 Tax=Serratia marcescens TaxID=615 RepID=UPI0027E42773|nr:hypothetical protein [Serratia marcescens]